MSSNSYFNIAPQASSSNLITPNVDLMATKEATTTTSLFSNKSMTKKDISCIPPAFFISVPENKTDNEPEIKETRSLSIGYGDRRLSGILSTEKLSSDKKQIETINEIPKKRVYTGIVDPSRGIFGNGHIIKKTKEASAAVKTNEQVDLEQSETASNTIKVFGYPSNLTNNVIQHFLEYGRISKHEQAPNGNWILITYENNASALAALKSNGVVISKSYLIGVVLHHPSSQTVVTQRVIPADEASDIFKPIKNSSSLGSGKAGVSAIDKNNSFKKPIDGGFISYIKESMFGW